MAANLEFQRVNEWHKLRGFSNLFRKESLAWLRTKRWWINLLLWSGLLGALAANILFVPTFLNLAEPEEIAQAGGEKAYLALQGLTLLFEAGSAIVILGAVVLCMDLVVEEKRNGVAEWLLSKPVARRSYILAKLSANLIYILLFLVLLPSATVYTLISLRAGAPFPPLPFLAAVGIMALHVLFYVTLTILLGALFDNRIPILGIALASLLGGNVIGGFVPQLLYVTPWVLPKVASAAAAGLPLPVQLTWLPVAFTLLWSVAFVAAALKWFEVEEL